MAVARIKSLPPGAIKVKLFSVTEKDARDYVCRAGEGRYVIVLKVGLFSKKISIVTRVLMLYLKNLKDLIILVYF
jgi:hypothetical protein